MSTVATGLDVAWDLAFLPDGRALVTERPGRVQLLSGERRLRRAQLGRIDVSAQGEGGLLGVAVDPRFGRDSDFVYFFFTTSSGMEVARYRLRGTRLTRDATILDGIEAGAIQTAGASASAPTAGCTCRRATPGSPSSRRTGSRNGKFLRMEPDDEYRGAGGTPEIFSRGHRNAHGFAWHPRSRRLISTEHGPTATTRSPRHPRPQPWPYAGARDPAGRVSRGRPAKSPPRCEQRRALDASADVRG